MKRIFNFLMVAATVIFAASCEQKPETANFEISSCAIAESAEFGTNLDFTVTAALASNVTVTVVDEDGTSVVTETVRESNEGVFSGKLAIPYTKNIADGTYSVLVLAIGNGSERAEKTLSLNLVHPEFTSASFVADKPYALTKGEGGVWTYTGALPATLSGYVEAKTADATFTFGGASFDNIEVGNTQAFEVYAYEDAIAEGTISFDFVSFAVKYPLNVKVVNIPDTSDPAYPGTVEVEFKKGALYSFDNLGDLWVDVDFFDKNENGSYTFRAETGRYKLTNQSDWGSLRVERINSTGGMCEFHWDGETITTNEAIWVIGNYNYGKPGIHAVREGRVWNDWETFDALCMAKIDTYKYQITLRLIDGASYKFFQTKLNWGDIYGANYDLANCQLNGLTKISASGDTGGDGNFVQSYLATDHTFDLNTDPDAVRYPEGGKVVRFTFDVTNPQAITVVAEDVTDQNLM